MPHAGVQRGSETGTPVLTGSPLAGEAGLKAAGRGASTAAKGRAECGAGLTHLESRGGPRRPPLHLYPKASLRIGWPGMETGVREAYPGVLS